MIEYISYILRKGILMKDFDKAYKHYDNFMRLFNLYKVKEIHDALELKGNETIVDIGGGTGYLAKHLSMYCDKIYVLDESKNMLSKVENKHNIITIVGDATRTEFEQSTIDIVILSDVLHHIKNHKKLLEEVYRILKINGKLLIMDFEKNHFKTKILILFEYLLFGKLYYKTHQEVIALLEKYFIIDKDLLKGHYFIMVGRKDDQKA